MVEKRENETNRADETVIEAAAGEAPVCATAIGAKVFCQVLFNGNCKEAFELYEQVLGGNIEYTSYFKDMPDSGKFDESTKGRVMHTSLKLADGNVIMGCDTMCSQDFKEDDSRVVLSLSLKSDTEADRVYAALSEGGKATMPLKKQFWGDYFGMFVDKFGVKWQIDVRGGGQDSTSTTTAAEAAPEDAHKDKKSKTDDD
jgi:PhnB protein